MRLFPESRKRAAISAALVVASLLIAIVYVHSLRIDLDAYVMPRCLSAKQATKLRQYLSRHESYAVTVVAVPDDEEALEYASQLYLALRQAGWDANPPNHDWPSDFPYRGNISGMFLLAGRFRPGHPSQLGSEAILAVALKHADINFDGWSFSSSSQKNKLYLVVGHNHDYYPASTADLHANPVAVQNDELEILRLQDENLRWQESLQQRIPSRFSYFSTYPVSGQQRSPAVCFELYQSGRYRIMRSRNGARETLGGTLNPGQLGAFAVLANALDFDNNDNEGVLIRQGSEFFVVEGWGLWKKWGNPDHQRQFPKSVVNIINWFQNVHSKGASPIVVPEVGEDPICPSGTSVAGYKLPSPPSAAVKSR